MATLAYTLCEKIRVGNTEKRLQRSMVTVVIAVLAALLSACGTRQAPLTVPAGAQAGDLVGLQSCMYEANKVEYGADCGTLVVPENRSDPDSRLMSLPVIRLRATGDDPAEPVFLPFRRARHLQPVLRASGGRDRTARRCAGWPRQDTRLTPELTARRGEA